MTKILTTLILAIVLVLGLVAWGFAATDLNNDGWPDITNVVISAGWDGRILWGAESNPYTSYKSLSMEYAVSPTVEDLNSDGYQDIIISNYSDGSTNYNMNSYVYWGDAGFTFSSRTDLPTLGAWGNAAADLNDDGYMDIVFANRKLNQTTMHANSYIYWGAATNAYSTKTEITEATGAAGVAIADLNNDDHLDIVFGCMNPSGNSFIYWGAASDPYTTSNQIFINQQTYDVSVADMNDDGYLDIVQAHWSIGDSICWGAETNPYSSSSQYNNLSVSSTAVSTADLNYDGYMDIVCNKYSFSGYNSFIYWGAESDPYSQTTLMPIYGSTYGGTVGDLNKDGYLDIAFVAQGTNKMTLYWGAQSDPYSTSNEWTTFTGTSLSIAGSNVFGSNVTYGTSIPLWATQGDYGFDILSSWEYQFVSSGNELLNEGLLDLSDEEIAQLIKLYNDQTGSVVIDGIEWSYYSDEIPEHGTPEAWYENGTYYFQMGSGVQGEPAIVPEPSTLLLLLPFIGLYWMRRRRK
ncbi:FG-GAP repeat domain-containing protein [Candidatus Auribacterota bacterium]